MSAQDDPAEVTRAREYRESLARRARAREALLRSLAGSRTKRAELADRFSAVVSDAGDRKDRYSRG